MDVYQTSVWPEVLAAIRAAGFGNHRLIDPELMQRYVDSRRRAYRQEAIRFIAMTMLLGALAYVAAGPHFSRLMCCLIASTLMVTTIIGFLATAGSWPTVEGELARLDRYMLQIGRHL